jgi:hypothetical protein
MPRLQIAWPILRARATIAFSKSALPALPG